ncbi:MAG: phosphohydrolase [Gammaproteobacteria bacterium]|nr:phosphohydrolase [Gammaproteobacteria bacterium]
METELNALVHRANELASLPEVVMRAVDMINDPEASAADIGNVIADDPALTARLLKIVNSPFYGFPSRIDTVSRAITVIGTLELLDLILATSVIKAFSGIPPELVNMDEFWEHSLYTGVVSRVLATRHRAPSSERFFIAGLLHDIGSLVIYRHRPEQAAMILEQARGSVVPLHVLERETFGFDHGQVGAALMQTWHLPDHLIASARWHHQPLEVDEHRLEVAMVHLADVIASAVHSTASETERVPPMDARAWNLVGLPADSVDAIISEADSQFADARAAILPSASAA